MNLRGGLFSEKEIEKLVSPERLDLLVTVTEKRGWVGLAATGLIVLSILAWSIFGTLTLTVQGEGILIPGDLKVVEAGTSGRVARVLVSQGTFVREGEPVAEVFSGEKEVELKLKVGRLSELRKADGSQAPMEVETRKKLQVALKLELDSLPELVQASEQSMRAKEVEISNLRMALRQGLIAESQLNDAADRLIRAQQEYARQRARIEQIPGEISKLELTGLKEVSERRLEIAKLTEEINELDRELDEVAGRPNAGKVIKAPASGYVVEVAVDIANVVEPKTTLMTIEPVSAEMEARIFVPAEEAKKVVMNPGAPIIARISPSNVKSEEYGFMLGKVVSVSPYPSAPDGMQRILRNSALVQKLSSKGPPILVTARLTKIELGNGTRRYKWSSSSGPEAPIVTGTLCKGEFEVERKAPIRYVVPAVKKLVGY